MSQTPTAGDYGGASHYGGASVYGTASAYNAPGMQRVPRATTAMAPPTARRGNTLQWRSSPQVAPAQPSVLEAHTGLTATAARPTSGPKTSPTPTVTPQPIVSSRQAIAMVGQPHQPADQISQAALATPTANTPSITPAVRHVRYNHVQDAQQMRRMPGNPVAVAQFELPAPGQLPVPQPQADDGNLGQLDEVRENALRDLFDEPQSAQPMPKPAPDSSASPLSDMMRQSPPESASDMADEDLPAPGDFSNPFDNDPDDSELDDIRARQNRSPLDTDDFSDDDDRLDDLDDDDSPLFDMDDEPEPESNEMTCEQFRSRISSQTIDQVSLDISPPYRPDEINLVKYEKLKARFDQQQPSRTFRNIAGVPLATGQFRDIAYGQVVLETDRGEVRLQLSEISEGDLAYVTEAFGLPNECLLAQQPVLPRNWSPTTFTWRASNLCHNPLYFQDVNLERYGHSHGPIAEPLVQTAHFFGSVLVLPYKMGVHHPRECIYTLGYYRPGNCAPWILPAVPISARGILNQAAVMTAGTLLIP